MMYTCNLTTLFSTNTVFMRKSTPIVEIYASLNELSTNLLRIELFPTFYPPISIILNM